MWLATMRLFCSLTYFIVNVVILVIVFDNSVLASWRLEVLFLVLHALQEYEIGQRPLLYLYAHKNRSRSPPWLHAWFRYEKRGC